MSESQQHITKLFDHAFNQEEARIIAEVLDPDTQVSLIVPDAMDPGKLWDVLNVCCGVMSNIKRASSKIKPIVGRLLVVLEANQELIREKGYKGFDDFMSNGMKELFGISRTESYECRAIAEAFPSMTVARFTEIGVSKLQVLVGVTGEHDTKNVDKWLERASGMSVKQLKKAVEVAKQLPAGTLDRTVICIQATVDDAKRWDEFVALPEVRAYCETDVHAAILVRLMEEAGGEWIAAGRHFLEGGR